MAAPPLDRKDLQWKGRSTASSWFRLPRRTRRATYLCWVIVLAIFYTLFRTATSPSTWQVPSVHYFDVEEEITPIRFPNLYRTLISAPGTRRRNRNVVFAASNLTAASKMAGIACEMAEYRRTYVHIALMGFDTLDVDEFKHLNGIVTDGEDDESCAVFFHDARAEDGEKLSLERRKVAVKSAFKHIGTLMGPQAIIVDPAREDKWFVDVAREKCKQIGMSFVELPEDLAGAGMNWITRLDSGSLRAWNLPTFEIVIPADNNLGNLERLLNSIERARYPSKRHFPTQITIIMDSSVPLTPLTKRFLRRYTFPSRTSVRIHRPLTLSTKTEDPALTLLNSFYSLNPHHSLLLLSPNAELSPWYFHYLLYTTLEYRYSIYNSPHSQPLYGVSLVPPSNLPSGSPLDTSTLSEQPVFLHPAPSTSASLFFPEHWSELHAYLTRILKEPQLPRPNQQATAPRELKLDKSLESSVTAHHIDLIRARGYQMLYPSLSDSLAILHDEAPGSGTYATRTKTVEKPLLRQSFPDVLPERDMPTYSAIPVVTLWGEIVGEDKVVRRKMREEAGEYRKWISTCPAEDLEKMDAEVEGGKDGALEMFDVRDLFCMAETVKKAETLMMDVPVAGWWEDTEKEELGKHGSAVKPGKTGKEDSGFGGKVGAPVKETVKGTPEEEDEEGSTATVKGVKDMKSEELKKGVKNKPSDVAPSEGDSLKEPARAGASGKLGAEVDDLEPSPTPQKAQPSEDSIKSPGFPARPKSSNPIPTKLPDEINPHGRPKPRPTHSSLLNEKPVKEQKESSPKLSDPSVTPTKTTIPTVLSPDQSPNHLTKRGRKGINIEKDIENNIHYEHHFDLLESSQTDTEGGMRSDMPRGPAFRQSPEHYDEEDQAGSHEEREQERNEQFEKDKKKAEKGQGAAPQGSYWDYGPAESKGDGSGEGNEAGAGKKPNGKTEDGKNVNEIISPGSPEEEERERQRTQGGGVYHPPGSTSGKSNSDATRNDNSLGDSQTPLSRTTNRARPILTQDRGHTQSSSPPAANPKPLPGSASNRDTSGQTKSSSPRKQENVIDEDGIHTSHPGAPPPGGRHPHHPSRNSHDSGPGEIPDYVAPAPALVPPIGGGNGYGRSYKPPTDPAAQGGNDAKWGRMPVKTQARNRVGGEGGGRGLSQKGSGREHGIGVGGGGGGKGGGGGGGGKGKAVDRFLPEMRGRGQRKGG